MKKYLSATAIFGLAALSLVATTECAVENDVGKLQDEADFVVNVEKTEDDESLDFDIGVGEMVPAEGFAGEARKVKKFPLKELRSFFADQKHKDLIVLNIGKNILDGEKKEALIDVCLKFFQDAGYARVVIIESNIVGPTILRDAKTGGDVR